MKDFKWMDMKLSKDGKDFIKWQRHIASLINRGLIEINTITPNK